MSLLQKAQALIHPMTSAERSDVAAEITQSISSRFDFFLLVVLSCSIATMGLIINSPAVIIGAMLLAPLMTPIIGLGLGSITGNARMVESALWALLRGAALAVGLSLVMTLINRFLPFVVLQELPPEVLSRTHPSPIDLVIALAGGLAAAYAMTRPNLSAALPGVAIATALMPPLCTIGIGIALGRADVAAGSSLLFITNAITIAFAAALVFFLRGFAPGRNSQSQLIPRSLVAAAGLTLALLLPLSFYSIKFFNEAHDNRTINEVVRSDVSAMKGAELVELNVQHVGDALSMLLTVRTNTPLTYKQVTELQRSIAVKLQIPVALKVNQIFAEQLDPRVPPTFTPTPTPMPTHTPGPTPTPSNTPTARPSPTPTPGLVKAISTGVPTLKLYQSPGGPVIGQIRVGQILTMLSKRQEAGGLIWILVEDSEGRMGWIPEMYLLQITATPGS